MNPRIKGLADAAGFMDSWFSESGDDCEQELKKFAELIVDECCLKLLDMDEKTKGHNNYYKHAALEIKKHFRGE